MPDFETLAKRTIERALDRVVPDGKGMTPDEVSFYRTQRSLIRRALEIVVLSDGVKDLVESSTRELLAENRDLRNRVERLKQQLKFQNN